MKLTDLVLTKNYVFNKISQEEIFEYYLGFPVSEGFHKNPLREDATAGCKFFYHGEYLVFHDFAWKGFNCFELVMQKYSLDYKQALRKIADDLITHRPSSFTPSVKRNVIQKTSNDSEFKIKVKPFTKEELNFWNVGGLLVTEEMLNKGGIYSVSIIWENGYTMENQKMVFAYVEKGIIKQIYFPKNKGEGKRRFRNKKGFKVGGWDQLRTDVNYVICTKSFKDMFILKLFGINAIYIVNEKILLDEEYMHTLESMYDFIGFLLDNDYTGKRQLIQYKWKYPKITPMLFNCNDGKDTYDVVNLLGADYLKALTEKVKAKFL